MTPFHIQIYTSFAVAGLIIMIIKILRDIIRTERIIQDSIRRHNDSELKPKNLRISKTYEPERVDRNSIHKMWKDELRKLYVKN